MLKISINIYNMKGTKLQSNLHLQTFIPSSSIIILCIAFSEIFYLSQQVFIKISELLFYLNYTFFIQHHLWHSIEIEIRFSFIEISVMCTVGAVEIYLQLTQSIIIQLSNT